VIYFPHLNQPFNNTIVDSQPYYFQVGSEGVAKDPSPAIPLPQYVPIPVPGFEAVIFLFSLIVVVVLVKYRKKDKKP
jgi:hypothetical protein